VGGAAVVVGVAEAPALVADHLQRLAQLHQRRGQARQAGDPVPKKNTAEQKHKRRTTRKRIVVGYGGRGVVLLTHLFRSVCSTWWDPGPWYRRVCLLLRWKCLWRVEVCCVAGCLKPPNTCRNASNVRAPVSGQEWEKKKVNVSVRVRF